MIDTTQSEHLNHKDVTTQVWEGVKINAVIGKKKGVIPSIRSVLPSEEVIERVRENLRELEKVGESARKQCLRSRRFS